MKHLPISCAPSAGRMTSRVTPLRPIRRLMWIGGLVVATATAAGCVTGEPAGIPREAPPRNYRVDDGEWPFWPQRMRIHPLSHFVKDRSSGDLLIEARIELFDPDGDTCKAVGRMDLDLYDADASQFMADPIGSWTTDLADLEVNQAHYDEVTRTYLFRLEVEQVPIPALPELRAFFTSGDGTRLQATYRLRPREQQ